MIRKNHWHMQRDETLRGRMRRFWLKLYLKMKKGFDKFLSLLIIHSSKMGLLAIFIVSVLDANVLNAILYVMFQLFSMFSYRNIRRFWKLTIIVDGLILIGMYVVDIFQNDFVKDISQTTQDIIGIQVNSKDETKFREYCPYLILLVFLVLSDYILNSQRYENFLQIYHIVEMSSENQAPEEEGSPLVHKLQKNQVGVSDYVTKFIMKTSIYILITALFIECSILPVSILNFILLLFMTVIVYQYLYSESSIQMYQNLYITLVLLRWTSFLIVTLKYMFQFQDYTEHLSEKTYQELKTYFDDLPLVRRLFGVENSHVVIKLLCLALVMSLSNYQLKYLKFRYLADIVREQDKDWNRLYFWNYKNQTKFKRVVHYIMVYGIFLAYHVSLIMPIIFLYRYSLKYISVIGFVVYLISVIIMYKQREQFWQYQHRLIGMISCFLILTNYGIQFVYLDETTNQKFIEWLGVEKQDKEVTATYDQLIPAFAILIICSLQKEAVKLYSIFKITVTQEDIDQAMEDLEKDNLKDTEYELAYKEKLEKLQTIFEYEKPIRQCLRFRDHYLKIFFYMYGYLILNFLFLFVIFFKLNLVSVQYSIQLVIFMVKGYYPLRFSQSLATTQQRSKAENQMKIQIIVISFFMLVQYFMSIGPADKFDYTSWKEHFSTYLCYKNSEECYNDWKDYLSLLNVPKSHIIVDIILIFGCYLILFYLSGQIELSLDQIENNPKIRDQNDFISEKPQSKLKNFIYYFIFAGFPYVFITYLLIFAATFHGAGAVDLISTFYLFFAMYYIIQFRKLYTSNSKLLKWLRYYNFIVLITLTIYQAPTFVCSSVDTFFIDTHYIARKKCADLELGNLERLDKTNSWLAFYIVFAQSFGLIKIDSIQMDFIVLIILTEIQNHIFHNPYFQVYILQHMKEEKQTDGKLRAFMFVERSHLRILWAYKAIKEEIKILHQRLVRLNKAIRSQEFSRHLILDDEEDDYHDRQKLLTDDDKSDSSKSDQIDQQQHLVSDDNSSLMQFNENEGDKDKQSSLMEEETSTVKIVDKEIDRLLDQYIIEIENINLELMQQPDTPVVPMKYFIETLKMHLKQNQEFLDLIKNGGESEEVKSIIKEHLIVILRVLQRQIYQKNRIDLYYKEGLGLNFAIQKGSVQLMSKSDYKFYKHLILGSSLNDALNNQNFDGQLDNNPNKNEANIVQDSKFYVDYNQQLTLAEIPGLTKDPSTAINFEVQENYQQNLSVIQDKIKPDRNKQSSVWKKISSFLRHYIWNHFINKQLFYSITYTSEKQLNVDQIPILRLLSSCLFSQSQNICYLMLFINFIINTNLISLIPALSSLLYALLDYPSANVKYWKFLMIYMLITVAVKFLYQLPIFCGTPAYEFFSVEACESYPVLEETLVGRIDYIIGVHKFSGPSSFPRDQGIVGGMACDVIVLFTLMLLKNYMIKIGQWHYVKNKNNIYQNPAFRCKTEELSEAERLNKVSRENYRIYEYESSNIFGKISIRIRQINTYIRQFLLKLLPTNMKPYQKNLDLRTQSEMPLIHHSAKQVKPGKDFFASNFFSLLLIFVFNLFFYRNVTGDDKSGSLANISLDRFSILQVSLLFFILLLMLVERMLYRVRYFDSSNVQVQSGILAKHQLTIKLGIYIFLVFGVHLYLGFLIKRSYFDSFFKKFPVILSYMLWIYHLISSALQIRYGYPQAAFKPPFTRDTSPLKVMAFRVYKALPFLWEMKVIIDWTVTVTCLDLFQWFKLDDAFNYLYANQFQNDDRRNNPEFAQRQWSEKFFRGFCFAFGLILVILAPILLFSGFNPILVKNPVEQANLQISFEINKNGNQHIILQTQAFNLRGLTQKEIDELYSIFIPINVKYDGKDLQMMRFSSYSESDWSISPPSLQKLIQDYNNVKDIPDSYVEIISQWNFRRDGPIGNEVTMAQFVVKMSANKLQPIIDMLSQNNQPRGYLDPLSNLTTNALTPNLNQSSVYVENIFPKVFRLGSTQRSNSLEIQTLSSIPEFSSAYLTLKHDGQNFYWTYRLRDVDQQKIFIDKDQKNATDKDQIIITYNDEVIGSLFGSSFQLSIVGLYATIVIAIGRFLRIIFDRISQRVIYEEMPDTELLFEICEGIFIAQLEGDLVREKRLYDMLIRMYRSPETLIKITGARLKHHHKHSQQQKEQLPQ